MAKDTITFKHPILERVVSIHKDLVEDQEWELAPHGRQEFLDWWWVTYGQNCNKCVLSQNRNMVVKPDGFIGNGQRPMIMICGEGPGVLEDFTGLPLASPLTLKASRCGSCASVTDCYSHKMLAKPDSRHPRNKTIKCHPQPTGQLQLKQKFYLQSAGSIIDGILIKNWKLNYPRQSWIELYNRQHPSTPLVHGSPWYITNTVHCRSVDALTGKDSAPGTAPKNICRKWLIWEWAAVQPKIIVCFGLPALEAFTQAKERSQIVAGQIFETSKFGPIIFQYHPARMMREDNVNAQALGYAKIAEVFKKALEYAGYPTE